MILRRRAHRPEFPAEKRQGYIDPREHDDPPFSPGHPFKKRTSQCVCCADSCHCCNPEATVPARPHKYGRVSEAARRYSVPSPPWRGSSIDLSGPKSASLPTDLDLIGRRHVPYVSWPFLREENETADELGTVNNLFAANANSVLGPLGALIAELHSRPKSADVHTQWAQPASEQQYKEDFTIQDMRHIWAHWVVARGQRRDERRGEVHSGQGVTLQHAEQEYGDQWKSAEMHGWI